MKIEFRAVLQKGKRAKYDGFCTSCDALIYCSHTDESYYQTEDDALVCSMCVDEVAEKLCATRKEIKEG